MAVVQSFRDLIVWQKSVALAVSIYRMTALFPKEEMYGLSSQLRRAAVSVASNISEGQGRSTTGEFRQFLGMARGSNCEVQTQLVIAGELGYANRTELDRCEGYRWRLGKCLTDC